MTGAVRRTAPATRLAHALLARELRPSRLAATAALAIAAGALLGRQLAGQTLPAGVDAPAAMAAAGGLGPYLLARVGGLLAVPGGVLAAALGVARVTGDHERGWLGAVVAAEPTLRGHYLLAVVAAATLAATLHVALAAAAFAVGGGLALADALARTAAALPGTAAFVLSAAAYGVAWGALLRRRGTARLAAAAGILVPVAVAAGWRLATGVPAPTPLARGLALLVPPLAWHSAPDALLRHAVYAAALLVSLTLLAPRLVARDR